jgi:hypothetical protein
MPHPRPHDHIAILPTQDGLLLRPHIVGQGESNHYVRITWGKIPEIEELQGPMENANVNWAIAIIVYGIVGILELFTGTVAYHHRISLEIPLNDVTLCTESYLLVITSRSEVGNGEPFRSSFLTPRLSSLLA